MFTEYFQKVFLLGDLLGIAFIPLILVRKKQAVSALSWILTVVFIPYLGVLLFLVFGASRVERRLRNKMYHHSRFLKEWSVRRIRSSQLSTPTWAGMDRYTERVGGAPASEGNRVQLYRDGKLAFKDKHSSIREARHHVHLEYYILRDDEAGRTLIDLLCKKAGEGVKVRLLLDAIGSWGARRLIGQLEAAGGKTALFLPAGIFGRRFSISLRNHRKLLICDGMTAFMGGLNIGNEYLGKIRSYGYWRDTHMKIEGPAVLNLQRVFAEDWDFATGELLTGDSHFPNPSTEGSTRLQIFWSGPDQEENATRETFFAAIISARRQIWISTPYFVPDNALLSALRTAALRGVDVRIITQSYPPDHWLTYWASRYYWEDLLRAGVRLFVYKKGMMHAKVMMADGVWGCVGSSNMDIRSFRLNFEVNSQIHSPEVVEELVRMFEEDQKSSKEIVLSTFRKRSWRLQLLENVCRLFSPIL